jgi:LytS/YehU family sensor histidine kinase
MTALRSQMNPHFIFNAIGSIQHFILQNEAKQSYNYLAKFSMLIRNILNNSREEYISLEQEVTTLQLYIELEQIRFTNPFQFIIDIDETIDMEIDIPTMLIQPYIENSIWHGLMPKQSGGILELLFKKVDSTIHVIIRDNGVGRKVKDSSQQYISKGMSITEQRIETLEATSQTKFNTRIVDLKDENNNSIGTEVNLIIPFDE